MSCQLPLLAHFHDVKGVKRLLFPSDEKDDHDNLVEHEEQEATSWDDSDWGWREDEDEDQEKGGRENKKQEKDKSLSWLQECCVSVSPTADFMAIGQGEKLVILSQKWDSHEESEVQTKYVVTFEGNLADQDEREKITAVLCLPLASQKKSTHGGPDWTCILVGFSSGFVRMYTENGSLLLAQIFSEEPVQQIRCRTYERPRHGSDAEKHEELTILYKKALVTIDGFSFFQSLRACRNQVARAAAAGAEQIQPPPLAYKKYGLKDQDQIHDHITCGMIAPNPFDQMVTGSMLGGYTATIKSTPPASHLYVTAGVQPCAGFYHAVEGSAQPMLSDVAHAVASKLKTALFSQINAASGWLGFGGRSNQENHKEKKKPKIEPATALPTRFGLPDKRRQGETICLSPDNRMAALTDSFGRVILLDIMRGTALRMWKGYRDAQVGWIEVKEETHFDHHPGAPHQSHLQPPRRAIFLVIYAPRRGILEVWASQQGSRVAAFNISRNCQLICPGHGMMGLNNVTSKSMKTHVYPCFLIDPEDGVRTIEVPFHLILSEKNSKRARDMHLLKKLKVALKESTAETVGLSEEITRILQDIRIASIRHQGLVKILHTRYLTATFLMEILMSITQQLEMQAHRCANEDGVTLDYDSRMLLQFCKAHMRLIDTYVAQEKFNSSPPSYESSTSTDEELLKCLGMTTDELEGLKTQMENYHRVLGDFTQVRFETPEGQTIADFLSCFDCQTSSSDADRAAVTCQISIATNISETKRHRLGNFLFKKALSTGTSKLFDDSLKAMCIPAETLMDLVLYMWLLDDTRQVNSIVNLHSLLNSISSLKEGTDLTENHNQISPWWQRMRDKLGSSESISSSYIAALAGRSVAIELYNVHKSEKHMSSSTDSASVDLSEWENVTIDRTQWTMSVRQLEDLLELQCLLKMKPASRSPGAIATGEMDPINVSVKKVQEGGRGVIPELVAKWIAGNGISPNMLCLTQEDQDEVDGSKVDQGQEVSEDKKPELQNPIVARLQVIQKRLPLSLDADTLMANCAWEYVLRWNKDVEVIFSFEQAVAYLKCIQNSVLQHGVAAMMWQMFVAKKLSSTAYLVEKVGKCPKERLCRKDVGMSDTAIRKLTGVTCELLETMIHVAYSKKSLARQESRSAPVMNAEDTWQGVHGPTSLVELAIDQKEANCELAEHHYSLCVILHAVFTFTLRNVKPFSFFDTKGKSAFFKPLHSSPLLPSRVVDDSLLTARRQFLCKIIHHAVVSLGERPGSQDEESSVNESILSLPLASCKTSSYAKWPPGVLNLARQLGVELDTIRRHHVCELYSSGLDKLAEEVLLTVSDHSIMGSQLMLISGQRLNHYISTSNKEGGVDKLANCAPNVSSWIKSLNPSQLRSPGVPLKDTAALVGQAVNQLPEGHSDYNMAIALVDLVHSLM